MLSITMRLRKKLNLVMLLCISFMVPCAQAVNTLIVKQLDVEQGLSQSSVIEIFQDSYGFIWLATEGGINRFDGKQFYPFSVSADAPFDVNQIYIQSIGEDSKRQIWLGTAEGIAIFDPLTSKFNYLTPKSNPQLGLDGSTINQIIRHSDGSMWVGTYKGLYQYNATNNTFTHHPIPQEFGANANELTVLIEAPNGSLIVGTQNQGVFNYNAKVNKFTRWYYSDDPKNNFHNQIHSLFFDSKQQLWVGSNAGLSLYYPNLEKFEQPLNLLAKMDYNQRARQRIRGIVEDTKGNIWISIYGEGIISFNPRTYEHTKYGYVPSMRNSLAGDALGKLIIDNDGMLWIGTEGYGVNIWNPISSAFSHINHNKANPNSINSNVVWSMTPTPDGDLWIGTEDGLNFRSAKTNNISRYQPKLSSSLATKPIIYKIALETTSDYMWQATNKGLIRYNPVTGDTKHYTHIEDNPQSISANLVYDVVIDKHQQLWIATDKGLDRLDLTSMQFYHYQYDPEVPFSITENSAVSKLFIDTRGDLWVGTNNGINRYNQSRDNFDRFLYEEGRSYKGEISFISTIAEIRRGVIWVGHSGKGISVLDFSNDASVNKLNPEISSIDIADGLPTNIIFGIIPDHFGRAWISTMAGLVLYEINGNNHQIFTVKDGLISNEFNDGAYGVAQDGTLYFGTINGLAIIKPGQMQPPKTNKRIVFTHATQYKNHGREMQSLIDQQRIELDIDSFAVTIAFTDMDFYWGHRTKYAYKYDQQGDWIDNERSNSITLNDLNIGKHQIQVRALNRNGQWSQVKTLEVIVMPPWWRTEQAYIGYALLIIMASLIWYRQRKDIHQEKQKMNAQLNLFAEAFKNTTEGVMIIHHSRVIVAVNRAFTTITGYSEAEVIDSGTELLNSNKHGQDFYDHIWQTLDEENQWQGEVWQRNKQEVDIAVEMTISAVISPAKNDEDEAKISHYVAVFSDITERMKAEQELRKLAKFDALTGLPNRTLLQDRLEHAIHHGHREQLKLAVMFLDLDRFKQVNDSLGHDIGDLLLIAVAERITKVLREDDTFARLGGDEFVIIYEDICEINKLVHMANEVIQELAKPFCLIDYDVSTSTSIGIAIYPDDGETSQVLMKNADTAMYHAKAEGRNNFQFYTQSMNVQAFERLSIENELRIALEEEQFILHYQPRVDSVNGNVRSLEALIRWEHPSKGLMAPAYFIDIAEESGLIVPISEWVINKACHQISSWTNAGFKNVSLSVNLSPRLFSHYDLVSFIEQTLQNYQISPSRLELEITESMLMNDVEATIEDLNKLNDLGCHISLDDFGTGYSSLSYLHRFPVHTLKIDRSFVGAINQHDKGKALVDIIINLAQNLGLEIVAEGVETAEQFEFLKNKAHQQIQGFYFSKAIDGESVIPYLINGFQFNNRKIEQESLI